MIPHKIKNISLQPDNADSKQLSEAEDRNRLLLSQTNHGEMKQEIKQEPEFKQEPEYYIYITTCSHHHRAPTTTGTPLTQTNSEPKTPATATREGDQE